MEQFNNANNEILSWDEKPITVEGFGSAPEGSYDFVVAGYERAYTEPKDGKAPTPKAIVELKLKNQEGSNYTHKVHLLLTKNAAWKIKSLFVAVGLANVNENTFIPYWNRLSGSSGKINLVKNPKPASNGKSYLNEIFVVPEEKPAETGFANLAANWAPQGGGF